MSKQKIKNYPLPILSAYEEFDKEREPFRKVHRLIDLIEVFLKFHTVLIVGRYFELEDISDTIKGIMVQGLKTPSLGIWWQFAREFVKELKDRDKNPVLQEIFKSLMKKGKIFKLMEGNDNLITFRNSYAHGATPKDEKCNEDIKKYGDKFFKVFNSSDYLEKIKLECSDKALWKVEGENIKKIKEGEDKKNCNIEIEPSLKINVFPLLVLKEDEDGKKRFYFYNDLRSSYVNILNYEDCIHKKEKELKEHILEKFPIHKWRKSEIKIEDKFRERIELLTETFKGRRKELQEIVDFLSKRRGGYLMIWGGPGIGKSALLARAVQMLSWSDEVRKEAGIEAGISKDKLHIIEYFIRRDMGTNNEEEFLDYMKKRIYMKFKVDVDEGKSLQDRRNAYINRLKLISQKLNDDERLVLIIDGLDEGAERPEFLGLMVREYIDKILVIYASRENINVRKYVYKDLERGHHWEMTLTGLNVEETRALLYEYVNKYELKTEFVENLTKKSEGNPLYIKLVCQGIQDGIYKLNDSLSLPKGLEEVYKNLMENFYEIDKEGKFFDLLMILTAGKDYFSKEMLGELMNESTPEIKRILSIVMEILIENPITQELLDYQLFHESLREYLKKGYKKDLREWRIKICEWIKDWKSLEKESLEYAMKHFFYHFEELYNYYREVGKNDKADEIYDYLVKTIEDEGFREKVFEIVGNDSPLRYGFKLLQKMIIERDKEGKEAERFFRYSRMINEEREIRGMKQFEKMIKEARDGKLSKTARYAQMGRTPRESLLYVLRALWEAPEGVKIPSDLKKRVNEWIEEHGEPVFNELINLTYEKKGFKLK